jgi:hypothetical protein
MFSLEIVPPRYHYTNSHQFICLSFSGSSEPNWNSKQQQMSERLKEKKLYGSRLNEELHAGMEKLRIR